MKIKVGSRKLVTTDKVDLADIPVGYIDAKDAKYEADFKINEKYATNILQQLSPYQKFTDDAIIFFDKNKTKIQDVTLKRQGNSWIYEPHKFKEYTPMEFECHANIRKTMKFDDKFAYDLKVCVGEEGSNLEMCSNLIKIFGNSKRGMCPANIKINNEKTEPESLLETRVSDCDFVFFNSVDGVNLPYGFDKNLILDKFTNIWISAETFAGFTDAGKNYKPAYNIGRLCGFYETSERTTKVERTVGCDNIPNEYMDYIPEIVYDDILLLEKPGCGYIIISPKELIDDVIGNYKIIYDVMMYIFLRSTVKTKTITSWITNEPIDYRAYSFKKLNMYHEPIRIKDMLPDNTEEGTYSVINIETNNDEVFLADITPEKQFFFRKIGSKKKDPEKKAGEISFLTSKRTVVNYSKEDIYLVKTKADFSFTYDKGSVYVKLRPFADSENCLFLPDGATIEITDMSKKYYFCVKPVTGKGISEVSVVDANLYSLINNGEKIAEVSFRPVFNTKIYDIRVKGGGLPVTEEDDYDMLDISSLYGRPYREGSTMIFKMPRSLEKHKDKIEQAIKKHIVASDTPVLFFNEEEI